ncbi:Glucosamine-6-phosphate isomerase (Glucosamine-6-phosphate deaminase) (GNPDA) (GlcN6P deaminase) [Linderina pennispora]|nr:Glucosamine-6-phosphate isomerase (Glucosamine-6-phosphate deaminase) (GNPDA) (GlcN6P deaminase) [Linderina pennispora]
MKITASVISLLAAIPAALAVWPIPRTFKEGTSNSQVTYMSISVQGNVGGVVRDAVNRYSDLINKESFTAPEDWNKGSVKTSGSFGGLAVSVENSSETLDLGTDESYTLDIPVSGQATLKAKTPFGVVRGLETLSQLVVANGNGKAIRNTPIHIEDLPAFPHRGLLFDTSRNYYSIESIKRTLDAMSYNKMNVFHWHVVDAHSWPIESKTYPELAQKGAYASNMQYSYSDVKDLIQYAKNRGIRIIPEFDVPGHTYIVGQSHPEIMSCLNVQPGWDKFAAEPPSGQLNIAKEGSIEFAKNIYKEYAALFPDSVIHVGGDEVNMHCWEADPDVQKYLAANKNATVESLLLDWYGKLHNYVGKDLKKTAFTWEETLFHHPFNAPKDTIVQTWIDPTSVANTVAKGYRAVSSIYSYMYLDCGHGAWLTNWDGNSWCDPFKTWMHVYNYDILANITDPAQQKLVLGSEAAIWSEQTDEHAIDPRIWPRAAAVAETTWSGKADADGHVRTTGEVASRLHAQRYRMVGRGINAEPMQPLWCARHPGQCNLP